MKQEVNAIKKELTENKKKDLEFSNINYLFLEFSKNK